MNRFNHHYEVTFGIWFRHSIAIKLQQRRWVNNFNFNCISLCSAFKFIGYLCYSEVNATVYVTDDSSRHHMIQIITIKFNLSILLWIEFIQVGFALLVKLYLQFFNGLFRFECVFVNVCKLILHWLSIQLGAHSNYTLIIIYLIFNKAFNPTNIFV